ncbi:TonB-linked outer membrane protein, SusC/RagA family [Filimonas lacunae]|uniref:TonB-linked outer membrane protein, SusC/RagA family n=1 Tax=Filimonas lacunae TaxID=477680 RepID=A0A1N7R8J7_9BACT|nr:TonB-dependent receptor [Filimonas lacunae]SIT31037.1 TonB-linked outer membrane protein, SusC/RagA family [Filimonas lacunae]
MKLTTVCMLAFVMSVSAKGLGQRKISIQAKNADISTILANIEQKSQYRFLYNTNLPAIKQKATLNVQDTEVREILGMLFKNTGLSFQFMENNLVVIKEGAAAPDEIIIKGKVVNETDGPLAGVSVQVKGGERGTTTNAEGAFTIRVDDANAILVFSYIGYDAKEVPVAGKSEVSVKMQLSTSQLDQVVVVGYGTQRKSQVVGSVAKVSGAEISKQPVLTAAQGLQGKTPGVQIMASGKPGDQPVVRIRGTNSVTGSADPIYVVDGVIMTDITNINSTDIQSVEVLKDASSQAIYGSRAGNGVVLITTKSGKSGRMRVGFDSYVGFKTPTSKVKMADAQTYAAYSNEALAYDGKAALFNLDTITNNTDWFKEITRNGMMQSHNVNLSGGTDKTTYYFSAGYLRDEGILRGNNYTRGVIRLNNEYKVASFLKLGHNLNLNIYKNNNKPNEFSDAYRMAPTSPVKYADGSYGYLSQLSIANPVAALDYTNDFSNGLRLQGNAYAELTPVKGLVIRSSFNFDQYNVDTTNYKPSYFVSDVQQNKTSLLTVANGKSFYYIFDNNATYSYNINKHEFKLTAGYSAERSRLRLSSFNEQNIPNQSNLWYIGQLGDVNTITGTSSGTMVRRASGYSRLGYSFDRRYNFTGVLRRDGSSKFPTGQKWGTFYSVGASWVISQEEFMKNQRVFDNLKARVGYGKVGNDNVSSEVAYLNPVGTTGSYYFGSGTNVGQGITVNQFISPNATWEPTTGFDAGIEFTTLNRRLTGEIGYYYKKTNAYIPVSLTSVTGDKDKIVYDRAADVSNRGVEITLNWQDRVNANFSYHVGANVTFNKNNVERVIGSLQLKAGDLKNGEITTYTVPGSPIGSFWVYQTDGIYRSQAEIDNSPHFDGTQLGDLKYKDVNGDGVLSDADRQLVGSYQPKMYFGFNTGFNYKKFDFSIDCYGNLGNKIYNGKKAIRFGNDNIEMARAENRWSPTNPNGTNPRASNAVPKPSTYYVESGSFFRINNITAGYTIPSSSWHLGISSLRVFVSAQNPIIIKKYSGYTPELPGIATEAGIEYNIYPVTSTYTMGVNLSF